MKLLAVDLHSFAILHFQVGYYLNEVTAYQPKCDLMSNFLR